jgi:hypothetical protein
MAETIQSDVPPPNVDLDNEQFWAAANRRQLLIGQCSKCQKAFFYPRHFCPFCLSADVDWALASGKAQIYSYTVMRRVVKPYVLAYVQLDEGPAMMTNIVESDFESLRVGQIVEAVYVTSKNGSLVPMFRPAKGHA